MQTHPVRQMTHKTLSVCIFAFVTNARGPSTSSPLSSQHRARLHGGRFSSYRGLGGTPHPARPLHLDSEQTRVRRRPTLVLPTATHDGFPVCRQSSVQIAQSTIKTTVPRLRATELPSYRDPHFPMPHRVPGILHSHIRGEESIFVHCAIHRLHVVLGDRIRPRIHSSQDRRTTLRGNE